MDNIYHISELIVKKIKGIITAEELIELDAWKNENPQNEIIFENAISKNQQLEKIDIYNLFDKDKSWNTIKDKLFKTESRKLTLPTFLKYAAGIILPILITGSLALYIFNSSSNTSISDLDENVKPGRNQATLILADGGEIELDSQEISSNIQQGRSIVTNENKTLIYSSDDTNIQEELIYNELITPRGGSYKLDLADGSKVWLNAGSSLRFPVSFSDSTRKVFLEGEAYFEVTHNGKPFIVSSDNMDIRVLGTSFNVSAYRDDKEVKTTLVEGKVSINSRSENQIESIILLPNKQATINKSDSTIRIAEVNTLQYTSWMKGKLEFNNETLEIVMKRLSRWYDFEYQFNSQEAGNLHFTARFNNDVKISTILEMLEMTTKVKFEIKENTIVIQ